MASTRNDKRNEAASKIFETRDITNNEESGTVINNGNTTSSKKQLWDRLWKALKTEQNKWWEATTLQKYIDVKCIPRGLRIFITPTFHDPDPELVTEWINNNHECSPTMLRLLVRFAWKDCEKQAEIIEKNTQALKGVCATEEFKKEMTKLENRLEKIEEEITMKKQRKFERDRRDYECRQILTFARKYDHLRGSATLSSNLGEFNRNKTTESGREEQTTVESLTDDSTSDISNASEQEGVNQKILKEFSMLAKGRMNTNRTSGFPNQRRGNRGGARRNLMQQGETTSPVGSRTRGQMKTK